MTDGAFVRIDVKKPLFQGMRQKLCEMRPMKELENGNPYAECSNCRNGACLSFLAQSPDAVQVLLC